MNATLKSPIFLGTLIGWCLGAHLLPPACLFLLKSGTFDKAYFFENAVKPLSLYLMVMGTLIGFTVGWFRNRLAQRNKRLRVRQRELGALLGEKETLLRALSHDLANHLGVAQGFLDMALDAAENRLEPETREVLGMTRTSLTNSMELIDFCRNLLAAESGKLEMALEKTDPEPLAVESLKTFAPRARAKNVDLHLNVECPGAAVAVEPVAFGSCVLNNLISNALKFSIPGGLVSVDLSRRGGTVEIAVGNYGPGIPADRLESLFRMDARTSTPGTAGERGTGFGLPLARKFVDLMGGTLRAASAPCADGGRLHHTVFTVSLPAANAPRPIRDRRAPLPPLDREFAPAGYLAA